MPFRPVSRYFDRISRPEQLLSSLPEAFRVLTDPADTGAVTISLPEDVQSEAYDWPDALLRATRLARTPAAARDRRSLPRSPRLIAQREATADRRRRRRHLRGGRGRAGRACEPSRHPCRGDARRARARCRGTIPLNVGPVGATGGLAANRLATDTDLVIAVGTRLGDFATALEDACSRTRTSTFVGININAARRRQAAGDPGGGRRARGPPQL